MAKYKITTDGGTYEVTTDEPSTPGMEKLGGEPPSAGKAPTVAGLQEEPESFVKSPHGFLRTGLRQMGQAPLDLASGRKAEAVSNLLEGAGKFAAPFAIPAAVAAPVAAIGAAAAGYGGSKLGEKAAAKFGASPETQRAVGDIAAIPAGMIGGGATTALARKAAEPLAESALGIRGTAKAYGATPGKAILDETTGVRPSSVEQSARTRLGELNQELESKAAAAPGKARLTPAVQKVAFEIQKAQAANSEATPRELGPMARQLTEPQPGFAGATVRPMVPQKSPILGPQGQPLMTMQPGPPEVAPEQSPLDLLKMKRQFGEDFVKNWNPAVSTKGALGTGRQAYHEMAQELNRVVPGAEQLNQRMSSLVPVAERARLTDLTAGPGERILNRVARPTGGLFPLLFGYHEAGIPGALMTMAGQEGLTSPAVRMIGARTLARPLMRPATAAIAEPGQNQQ